MARLIIIQIMIIILSINIRLYSSEDEITKKLHSIYLSETELIGQYYNNLSSYNIQQKLELKKDSCFTFIELFINTPYFNSVLVDGKFKYSENILQLNIENVYNYSFEDTILTEKKVLLGNLRKKEFLYRNETEKYLFRHTTGGDLFNDIVLVKGFGSLILLVPSKCDKNDIQYYIHETDREKQLKVYWPLLKKRTVLSDDFMNPEVFPFKISLE